MAERYSRADFRRGRFRRTRHGALGELLVGISFGRVVVLVRSIELAARSDAQVAIALDLADESRAFLAGAGWWRRLLSRSAVVVAFEAEEARADCTLLRYTECVVTTTRSRRRAVGPDTAGRLDP